MTTSPPSSFFLEKDQFLYIYLVSLQMEDSRTDDGTLFIKGSFRKIFGAIILSWSKYLPPLPVTIAKN